MNLRDVGVGPQPVAQRVISVRFEDGTVGGVGGEPASGRAQLGGKLKPRHRGIQRGVEKEGDRDAIDADFRRLHFVQGRFEVAVSGQLEHLANVDHKRAGERWGVDPLALVFDLKAIFARLDKQESEHAAVAVRAYSLLGHLCALARVPHDLDEGKRLVAKCLVENALGSTKRNGPRAHELERESVQFRTPPVDGVLELGQSLGPQVGTFESPVLRGSFGFFDGVPLDANVDLLAPVDITVGEFATHPRVTAKLWAVDVLNCEFVLGRQLEETPGDVDNFVDEVLFNSVSDKVEEAHLVSDLAKLSAELFGCILASVESRNVENGKRRGHAVIFTQDRS